MSDETTNKTSIIELPELPPSVDNAIKNLTDEPTKNAGKALGDIFFLVFGGISQAAEKRKMKYSHDLKLYEKELEESIEQIPEENKIEPSIQITAQALENSKYCISEPELRKMFVNLITSSMDSSRAFEVHPSFPEIIKQMSPLDAEIISDFKKYSTQPIARFDLKFPNGSSRTLDDYLYFSIEGSHSYPYAASISSLERLGLLSVDFSNYLTDASRYQLFTDWSYYKHLKRKYEDTASGQVVNIVKGICSLTPLGRTFIEACVP